jgi:hypothetical protein
MEATKPKIVSRNAFAFLVNGREDIKPIHNSTPSKKKKSGLEALVSRQSTNNSNSQDAAQDYLNSIMKF